MTNSTPIVLVVVAALVVLRPGRWTGYVALIVPLVLAAGLIGSAALSRTFVDQLTDTGNVGTFVGSILHVGGLIAAVAGGVGVVLRRPSDPMTPFKAR